MATCATCGRNAGLLSKEGDEGRQKGVRAEAEASNMRAEAAVAETRVALEAARRDVIAEDAKLVERTVAGGVDAFLYRTLYVPVDSVVNEEPVTDDFHIEPLQQLGLLGWEVVGV